MSQSAQSPKVLQFGVFDVDMQAAELRKTGLRVKLQQQPFQVLAVLLERPGEVVTREELRQRLWTADTFVDFDLSLNSALKKLRYALGDDADNPLFIETIPRRGYRFIATVTPMTVDPGDKSGLVPVETPSTKEEPSLPVLAAISPSAIRRSWPRAAKVFLLALAVTATILVVSRLNWRALSPAKTIPRVNIQSLAVLPLENLSGDPSQAYFAEGMTDELITNLGQISSLRVISRTSAIQYRGSHKPLSQIARELNVDAIVEGTVVRYGGRVRIAAQLIQASTDRLLWAQSYESDLKDVLALQHEIASAIAQQVRITLTPGEEIRTGIRGPVNLEAYESYLRGEYYLNRFTPESIQKAAEYFQQAIANDPDYPPAYSKLANCYQILANMRVIPAKVGNQKARTLTAKALELDPDFGPAHAGRGWGLLMYDLDFAAAGAEFKRAVELNPNSVEGHQGLGDYYATVGQLQEAVREAERARSLDPLATIVNSSVCEKLLFARRYDDALAQCKANLDLDSSSVGALAQLGSVYAAKGMGAEAAAALIQVVERSGVPLPIVAALKRGANEDGVKGLSRAWLQIERPDVNKGEENPLTVAAAYTDAGDADKALTWLEKAVETRCYGITYLAVDPAFDGLRSDPRFVSLLKRMGLPQRQSRNQWVSTSGG